MINKLLYIYQVLKDILDNLFSNQLKEEKILKKHLKGKIVYFDLGYNLGFETQKVKKIFNQNLEIHAFEPNLTKINIPADIKFNNCAISEKNTVQKFIKKKISSNSGFYKYLKKEPLDTIIKVKTIRLDDYCNKNKINKIDYMKIDTEGSDLECLVSLGKSIKKLKLLKIELTYKNYFEILNFLNSKSFNFLGMINTKYRNNTFDSANAFFINLMKKK